MSHTVDEWGATVLIPVPLVAGFSYTVHCSPEFPVRMSECYDSFQETKVALYHSMLAVIRSEPAQLDSWCRWVSRQVSRQVSSQVSCQVSHHV